MANSSTANLVNEINSEYNKKLRALESKLAIKHKELKQVEHVIAHDTKRVDHLNLSKLKSKKAELNTAILLLKKEIKKVRKEKIKKLRKL